MAAVPSDAASKSIRRSWLKFSIRTLLVLVALLGLWMASHVNRVHRQETAVAVILDRGGRIRYDWQPSLIDVTSRMKESLGLRQAGSRSPVFTDEPRGPKWLRRLVGDDYFQHVVEVDLRGNRWTTGRLEISHQEMKQIASLRQLERLVLVNTTISDTSLEPISRLPHLRTLIISDSSLTDAGLLHLHHLAELEQLQLSNTAVTADGIGMLRQQLPKCEIRLDQRLVP